MRNYKMKTYQINIRMTEEEFQSLQVKSKELGVTKSSLVLDTIKGISVENYKLKRELNEKQNKSRGYRR